MRRLDNIDLRLLRGVHGHRRFRRLSDAQVALNLSQSTLSTHLSRPWKRSSAASSASAGVAASA